MTKVIDIEYCGGWGYGGPANRLKKALSEAFPNVTINCHSANGMTSRVEVAWIDGGNKQIIWSKGKNETESGHANIIAALKGSQWKTDWSSRETIIRWEITLKVMEFS